MAFKAPNLEVNPTVGRRRRWRVCCAAGPACEPLIRSDHERDALTWARTCTRARPASRNGGARTCTCTTRKRPRTHLRLAPAGCILSETQSLPRLCMNTGRASCAGPQRKPVVAAAAAAAAANDGGRRPPKRLQQAHRPRATCRQAGHAPRPPQRRRQHAPARPTRPAAKVSGGSGPRPGRRGPAHPQQRWGRTCPEHPVRGRHTQDFPGDGRAHAPNVIAHTHQRPAGGRPGRAGVHARPRQENMQPRVRPGAERRGRERCACADPACGRGARRRGT